MVCLKTFQRTIQMTADFISGKSWLGVRSVINVKHVLMNFCCQNCFFTASTALFEPSSDDLLGDTYFSNKEAVVVCGVKEINSGIESCIHDSVGIFLVCTCTEIHGSQAKLAYP